MACARAKREYLDMKHRPLSDSHYILSLARELRNFELTSRLTLLVSTNRSTPSAQGRDVATSPRASNMKWVAINRQPIANSQQLALQAPYRGTRPS